MSVLAVEVLDRGTRKVRERHCALTDLPSLACIRRSRRFLPPATRHALPFIGDKQPVPAVVILGDFRCDLLQPAYVLAAVRAAYQEISSLVRGAGASAGVAATSHGSGTDIAPCCSANASTSTSSPPLTVSFGPTG